MLEADTLATLFDESADTRRNGLDPYKELRYLVIDDQPTTRQTLKICIQSMGGFSVDQADSFNDAVHRIARSMPDVIICDYILGNGRTGQQLLEDLRRSDSLPDTVAFLIVTAERSYEQVVSAVELVPDDYIIKPFSPEILRSRMDRVIRKKVFFHRFYKHLRRARHADALAELDALECSDEARLYRFDILRARAECLLRSGRFQDAFESYSTVVAIHPFPWAMAGQARALKGLHRYEEAHAAIDGVIAAAPNYFDAYDLQAEICCDLGAFAEAQQILQGVAARTPRNWRRKRQLSSVAKQNGDFDTAKRLIEEVIANAAGSAAQQDQIELARLSYASGDHSNALEIFRKLPAADRDSLNPAERINIECMEALMEGGEEGQKRFERIRADLSRLDLPVEITIDAVRAALSFEDIQLADRLTAKLLVGPTARRAFNSLLEAYRTREMEEYFRRLQQSIAARRLGKR